MDKFPNYNPSFDPKNVGNKVNKNVNDIQKAMDRYQSKQNYLNQNSDEIYYSTNTVPHLKNINKINYRYSGSKITGYKELPNIYDGYYKDINQMQLAENTIYVSGVIVCTSLLIAGIVLATK